jgi:nitrite reductase/ring-hydroxylating ferredoxin subunit
MEDSLKANQHPVCKSSELADNTMRKIIINMVDVLVGKKNGKLFACNNSCPHKGASLSKGDFNGENIVCYMHGYEYNLFTGKLENMKSWKKEDTWIEQDMEWRKSGDLILYKIFEENEIIYVKLN